jgi:diacylglycerol kinase (ATP)
MRILLFLNTQTFNIIDSFLEESKKYTSVLAVVQLPKMASDWPIIFKKILTKHLRVVVVGGDATVNWVTSILFKHFKSNPKPIAIYSFGTGNDLSRTLGFAGKKRNLNAKELFSFIDSIPEDSYVNLDIWNVSVNSNQNYFMTNYFSLGTDAQICYDFDQWRKSCSCLFGISRLLTKSLYFPVGFKNLFCKNKLKDYCQCLIGNEYFNSRIDFTNFEESIVLQNIFHIYGGSNLWTSQRKRSLCDGKLEIIGQCGSHEIGLAFFGLNFSREVMQGDLVIFICDKPCYYQIAGEGRYTNEQRTIFEINKIGQ